MLICEYARRLHKDHVTEQHMHGKEPLTRGATGIDVINRRPRSSADTQPCASHQLRRSSLSGPCGTRSPACTLSTVINVSGSGIRSFVHSPPAFVIA